MQWGHFKSGVSAVLLAEVADSMVSLGLRDAGYEYVNTGAPGPGRPSTAAAHPAAAAALLPACPMFQCACRQCCTLRAPPADDGWLETNRTVDGRLVPSPGLFPLGGASVKNLTDYVHSRGMDGHGRACILLAPSPLWHGTAAEKKGGCILGL